MGVVAAIATGHLMRTATEAAGDDGYGTENCPPGPILQAL